MKRPRDGKSGRPFSTGNFRWGEKWDVKLREGRRKRNDRDSNEVAYLSFLQQYSSDDEHFHPVIEIKQIKEKKNSKKERKYYDIKLKIYEMYICACSKERRKILCVTTNIIRYA